MINKNCILIWNADKDMKLVRDNIDEITTEELEDFDLEVLEEIKADAQYIIDKVNELKERD